MSKSKSRVQEILDQADFAESKTITLPNEDTQQQILACLKRIECMLKDEEDERLRAKRELRDRMNIYQGKQKEDEGCL